MSNSLIVYSFMCLVGMCLSMHHMYLEIVEIFKIVKFLVNKYVEVLKFFYNSSYRKKLFLS